MSVPNKSEKIFKKSIRGKLASFKKKQRKLAFLDLMVSLQTSSSLIEGSWQLIFTTRPGTASPIQVKEQKSLMYKENGIFHLLFIRSLET